MFLPALTWHSRFYRTATLTILALCLAQGLAQGPAHAGDLEDCNGGPPEKIEAGCTAIINNPARTADEGIKALVNRARVYANRGELDAGMTDLEAALKLDAQSVPALLLRGFIYQRKNNLDLASADFEKAIELDPKNTGALLSRAYLRLQQRNWPEAMKDFDQTLTLRQNLP